jgi:hypothetical protein
MGRSFTKDPEPVGSSVAAGAFSGVTDHHPLPREEMSRQPRLKREAHTVCEMSLWLGCI